MPDLLPLTDADLAQPCSCQFGRLPGQPLLAWSQDAAQSALVRDAAGLHRLQFFSAKYLPEKRELPRRGDRTTWLFSDGTWHIQAVAEVVQVCAAKARRCQGTAYRSQLVLQWQGRERKILEGWGRCSC